MTGSVYGSENADSAQDNGAAAITQPPPMMAQGSWTAPRAPYDTSLSTRPLPPDSVYRTGIGLESSPPGAVYDTGLTSAPNPYVPGPMPMPGPMPIPAYPSVGPPSSQADLFVHAVRTEITQLESYFKRQTRRFRFLGAATLVMAAAVPVVIAAGAWSWIAAALGAIAAITGSLQTLFGLQAAAASAMSLAGRLESELVRFETGTTPYSSPPGMCFNQFVDRVTSLREEGTASFSSVWRSVQAPAPR